jgi:glycosyltransferase involved in cell wall biosynthesis
MDPTLISVIIPCYNQSQFLGAAIDSVLNQTYPCFEIIVIDDGSEDWTHSIVSHYSNVHYIRQENQGLSGARNTGLQASQGKYLVFLDADDRLLPNALEVGLNCLRAHPHCAFVAGHHRYISTDGSLLTEFPARPIGRDHYLELLKRNYIAMHATVMYQRTALEEAGAFDTSLAACEDYELYLRIARRLPIYCHTQMIAEYRQHDENMSSDFELMIKTALQVLRRQRQYLKPNENYTKAYKEGMSSWREYFGEKLLSQAGQLLRRREAWRALSKVRVLLWYAPDYLARKLFRIAYQKLRMLCPISIRRRLARLRGSRPFCQKTP